MVSTVERKDTRFEGLDSLCRDVEIDVSELPDGRILRGREAVEVYLDSLCADVWSELKMQVEAISQQGDKVVAQVRLHGVGGKSGVPVEMRATWIANLRDGRVASARLTFDRKTALEPVAAE